MDLPGEFQPDGLFHFDDLAARGEPWVHSTGDASSRAACSTVSVRRQSFATRCWQQRT
jgi:hypothetical protein